jgi:hypothetical protein
MRSCKDVSGTFFTSLTDRFARAQRKTSVRSFPSNNAEKAGTIDGGARTRFGARVKTPTKTHNGNFFVAFVFAGP